MRESVRMRARRFGQNVRGADLIIVVFALLIRELAGTENAVFFMALLILLVVIRERGRNHVELGRKSKVNHD